MTQTKFFLFLSKHKVLKEYKESWRCDSGNRNMNFRKWFNKKSPRSLISGAFRWDGTQSGDEFWAKLNGKWVDSLKD